MPRYTDIPSEHYGEAEVAHQLEGMQDRACHRWYSLNYLRGVRDIDLLVLHEDVGLFVVEIKGVTLSAIKSFGAATCEIEGRGQTKSPQLQAYEAATDLRNYLGDSFKSSFFVATVCWPRITRRTWNERMQDGRLTGDFAEGMIFKDDLTVGAGGFRDRLERIYWKPCIRAAPARAFSASKVLVQQLRNALRVETQPKPTPSDLARLQAIEAAERSDAIKHAPPDQSRNLIYIGHPGTGKTFRLLEIGHRHALAGKSVLLACFNKVLATDLRRLMSFSRELRVARGLFEIRDVFALVKAFEVAQQIDTPEGQDHDEWASEVVAEMKRVGGGSIYDTILIDEAQDLKSWGFDLLEWMAKPEATVAVAIGRDQELYGEASHRLSNFRRKAKEYQLRRNFRNTRPVFRLAQVIYEAGYDSARMEKVVQKFRDPAADDQLEFLREAGELPQLRYVDDSRLEGLSRSSPAYAAEQYELMVTQYQRIIANELGSMGEDEWPMDLLILVPAGAPNLERQWASAAIQRLGGEYEFLDYTEDSERRHPAQPRSIRLCTYHSSRGIEGIRTIVFGFENLERVAASVGVSLQKLAYIALSRSVAECVLVFPRSSVRTPSAQSVEQALGFLSGIRESVVVPPSPPPVPPSPPSVPPSLPPVPPPRKSESPSPEVWKPYAPGEELRPNDCIRHDDYGRGVVVIHLPGGTGGRLVVDFDAEEAGTKNFFLSDHASKIQLRITPRL